MAKTLVETTHCKKPIAFMLEDVSAFYTPLGNDDVTMLVMKEVQGEDLLVDMTYNQVRDMMVNSGTVVSRKV